MRPPMQFSAHLQAGAAQAPSIQRASVNPAQCPVACQLGHSLSLWHSEVHTSDVRWVVSKHSNGGLQSAFVVHEAKNVSGLFLSLQSSCSPQ